MSSRSFSDFPRNEPGLVDKFIGTAYDVVKNVGEHLQELQRLDGVLEDINELAPTIAAAAVETAMVPAREELDGKVQEAATQVGLAADQVTLAAIEADRAETEADRAATAIESVPDLVDAAMVPKFVLVDEKVDAATTQANRAQTEADRAETEADRATAQAELNDPDRIRQFAITSEEIISGFEVGGVLRPKNGGYYMLRKALFNYAGVVGFAGHPSPRQSVVGEVPGGTIMSVQHADWCMESTGPAPFTQAAGGADEFGNMTFVGPDVTGGAGAIGSGKGLRISNRAGTHLHDLNFINLERPLHLDGVLSSNVSRINSSGCYHPILINTTDETSGPNAMSFNDVRVANHVTHGVVAECGAAMNWSRFTGEGCGRVGSQDVVFSLTSSYEPFAGVSSVFSPYFELNAGLTDMYFENKTSGPMVIHVTGGLFARVSVDRFVENHILANNLGSGSLDVFIYDSIFVEGFGYPASAARPITRAVGDRCRIHLINCYYKISPVTPVPLSHSPNSTTIMNMEANGGLYNPGGWTCIRTPGGAASGDYTITRDVPIARNVYSYMVNATHAEYAGIPDTANRIADIHVRRLDEYHFRIRTYNAAGVTVDAGLDISVSSMT